MLAVLWTQTERWGKPLTSLSLQLQNKISNIYFPILIQTGLMLKIKLNIMLYANYTSIETKKIKPKTSTTPWVKWILLRRNKWN